MYETVIKDKHEDVMARLGAVLGQGIIDAGGRNVTISLQSASGHSNMSSIVGMAIFTQFWYWYPLTHFLSLAFTPTAVIGVNKALEVRFFFIIISELILIISKKILAFRFLNLRLFPMRNPPYLLILLLQNHPRRKR